MNIHENDPLELIRQADPAPRDSMPTSMSPLGRSIRARVAEEMIAERPRNNRRLVVRVLIALVVAALATAATWIITREASDPSGVVCYEEASLESTGVVAAAPLDASLCAPLWAEGVLQNPAVERGAAPQLVACVNPHGVLVIFPASDNSDVCRDLNLPRHKSSTTEQLLVDMNNRLNRLFAEAPCLGLDDANLQTTEILRATGLEDWTVAATTAATDERPCASYGIDAGSETVVLVPAPDQR
ncbi:MAG: hypothetical protein OXF75_06710 [Acidimicrobiaceae bacterium]|nr:hypothetical protein [Acidimicrobiaceae bacterium]